MPLTRDGSYFARRARQSEIAMHAAGDRTSRLVHAKLMAAYERLDRQDANPPMRLEIAPVLTDDRIAGPLPAPRPPSLELPARRTAERVASGGRAGLSAWDDAGGSL